MYSDLKESLNPIRLVKDNISYAPSTFLKTLPPFKFICNDVCVEINRTDIPKYFSRTVLKIGKGRILRNIKYYIGKETEEGKLIYYWIDVNGKIIEEK